jgi:HEPN domain-containing protein
MTTHLQHQPIVKHDALVEIAKARIEEAKVLFDTRRCAGAVYLGGYAVECYLKAAICHRLDWSGLHVKLKTHDLLELLQFTGLSRRLEEENLSVYESFKGVLGLWNMYANDSVGYRRPSEIDESTARQFLEWVLDSSKGVVPWLQKVMS